MAENKKPTTPPGDRTENSEAKEDQTASSKTHENPPKDKEKQESQENMIQKIISGVRDALPNLMSSSDVADLVDGEGKDEQPRVLEEMTLEGVAKYIKDGKAQNIIVMTGAGISTSAGIPDFRSPKSGLYANLAKYDLPDPQAIFSIGFFHENPKPFFHLAKELFPGKFKPTPCHYFIRLLEEKNLLLRTYTQNIDTLEHVAGMPADKVVEAHGTFYTSHCLKCRKKYSLEWMKREIFEDKIPRCEDCNNVVKPDIVFFGENLPRKFFTLSMLDFPSCDLLIVMGTSLVVQPFAGLVGKTGKRIPRLLINRDKVGESDPIAKMLGIDSGFDFDGEKNKT